jgi:hypothetical protein
VRAAEGGKEVVESGLIGHIDNREACAPAEAVPMKIVIPERNIK